MVKKCYHCREKIKKKEGFVKKYDELWLSGYSGNHSIRYWHPWCWNLCKKDPSFGRFYVDEEPNLIKKREIQKVKEEYLIKEASRK